MTASAIILLLFWGGSHFLLVLSLRFYEQTKLLLIVSGLLLLVLYLVKPYTYDLPKYSLFFNTGFIQTLDWGWHSPDDPIELDVFDTTGEPFGDGFEIGFSLLARWGNAIFPMGEIIPRLNVEDNDFKMTNPRADFIVYLIMCIGIVVLYSSAKMMFSKDLQVNNAYWSSIIFAIPIILGSIFFLIGSQNSLRQFLAISIVLLAVSVLQTRRYLVSAVLILLSAAFHRFAPFIGIIAVFLVILGNLPGIRDGQSKLSAVSITRADGLALVAGLVIVFVCKAILVFDFIYLLDMPLISELRTYIFGEFDSIERLSLPIKLIVIIALFFLSELLIGTTDGSGFVNIRCLRRRVLVFSLPFAIFPEIFSRMLILYWAVEVLFLIWAFSSSHVRIRAAAVLIFVCYGVAPNGLNILVGSDLVSTF